MTSGRYMTKIDTPLSPCYQIPHVGSINYSGAPLVRPASAQGLVAVSRVTVQGQ